MPPVGATVTGPPIVVGVDGSEPGLAAARWAAVEAHLRNLPLWVVHAGRQRQAWVSAGTRHPDADAILAMALDAARTEAARTPIAGQEHTGLPDQTLIELSAHASLVVVGHRGHGCASPLHDLRSALVTSVTAHAFSPVAVVRQSLLPAIGLRPVVVGVDGSAASVGALNFAFEEAALRHVPLEVVYAVLPGPRAGRQTDLDSARENLHELVGPWQDAYPRLAVTLTALPAHPVTALTAATKRASLLVIGARGSGGYRHLRLGSISQQVIHLGSCPVLVTRKAPTMMETSPVPTRRKEALRHVVSRRRLPV